MWSFKTNDRKSENELQTSPSGKALNNEDLIILRDEKLPDNCFRFYKSVWSDRNIMWYEWLYLKHEISQCSVIYKRYYDNQSDNNKGVVFERNELCISTEKLASFSFDSFVDFAAENVYYDLKSSIKDKNDRLSKKSIADGKEFFLWINTLFADDVFYNAVMPFTVKERVYSAINGYFDSGCHLVFDKKDLYFYFKEMGNNKGYRMGSSVYEIDRSQYFLLKDKKLDRDSATKHILDLPHGDEDWTESNSLLRRLVLSVSEHDIL